MVVEVSRPLISEILVKVNNAKDKPKKIAVLKQYDSPGLRMVLKSSFDPKIQWRLPTGDVPFKKNDAPAGTEHTRLEQEARTLFHYIKGGNDKLSSLRRETMFINILEGLHPLEAEIIVLVKDKDLETKYKITKEIVSEAYPDITWGGRS